MLRVEATSRNFVNTLHCYVCEKVQCVNPHQLKQIKKKKPELKWSIVRSIIANFALKNLNYIANYEILVHQNSASNQKSIQSKTIRVKKVKNKIQ